MSFFRRGLGNVSPNGKRLRAMLGNKEGWGSKNLKIGATSLMDSLDDCESLLYTTFDNFTTSESNTACC